MAMVNWKTLKRRRENKKLIKEFPFLEVRNVWNDKPMKNRYDITWLDDMPSGWRKAFGLKMCQEIKDELVKHNFLKDYRIHQIKEKYGTLRWYDGGYVGKIDEIISKYEDLSMCYCQHCGKPTKYYTKGWVTYICEDCKNELITKCNHKEVDFVKLKKSDLPYHVKMDSSGKKEDILYTEVKQLVDENWSD